MQSLGCGTPRGIPRNPRKIAEFRENQFERSFCCCVETARTYRITGTGIRDSSPRLFRRHRRRLPRKSIAPRPDHISAEFRGFRAEFRRIRGIPRNCTRGIRRISQAGSVRIVHCSLRRSVGPVVAPEDPGRRFLQFAMFSAEFRGFRAGRRPAPSASLGCHIVLTAEKLQHLRRYPKPQ